MSTSRRTVGFNFLEELELPGPQVTEAQAEKIVAEHYGLPIRATLLGSNQDCNFVCRGAGGEIVGVLKIANPAFTETELEAQDVAADLIAEAEPSLRIVVALPTVAGEKCTVTTGLLENTAYVRLLRFLPGGTLYESGYLSPTAVAGLGEVAGRVSRALAAFDHPGLDRALQWDLRYGADVVAKLISHVGDPSQRAQVEEYAAAAWSRIEPLADALPLQATHLDLTDANVVVHGAPAGPSSRTASSTSATCRTAGQCPSWRSPCRRCSDIQAPIPRRSFLACRRSTPCAPCRRRRHRRCGPCWCCARLY